MVIRKKAEKRTSSENSFAMEKNAYTHGTRYNYSRSVADHFTSTTNVKFGAMDVPGKMCSSFSWLEYRKLTYVVKGHREREERRKCDGPPYRIKWTTMDGACVDMKEHSMIC
uniref:Uncharacterized protein n=1 Tax=Ascaris lumbricoides TaxID=6252 RepID=A0A9J2P3D6_ASCLU